MRPWTEVRPARDTVPCDVCGGIIPKGAPVAHFRPAVEDYGPGGILAGKPERLGVCIVHLDCQVVDP